MTQSALRRRERTVENKGLKKSEVYDGLSLSIGKSRAKGLEGRKGENAKLNRKRKMERMEKEEKVERRRMSQHFPSTSQADMEPILGTKYLA